MEHHPQSQVVLRLAQINHNDNFDEGRPINRQGIASRYRFNFDQDGRSEPGRRKGAASRGNCPPIQPALNRINSKNKFRINYKRLSHIVVLCSLQCY
jgi:hypothetical protein